MAYIPVGSLLRGVFDPLEEVVGGYIRQKLIENELQKRYELKKAYEDYLAQKAYEIGKKIGESLQGKPVEEQVQELYSLLPYFSQAQSYGISPNIFLTPVKLQAQMEAQKAEEERKRQEFLNRLKSGFSVINSLARKYNARLRDRDIEGLALGFANKDLTLKDLIAMFKKGYQFETTKDETGTHVFIFDPETGKAKHFFYPINLGVFSLKEEVRQRTKAKYRQTKQEKGDIKAVNVKTTDEYGVVQTKTVFKVRTPDGHVYFFENKKDAEDFYNLYLRDKKKAMEVSNILKALNLQGNPFEETFGGK